MITGKINLMNLHAVRKTMKGESGDVECLIIPIKKNKLYSNEKSVYLDIVAFEIKEPKADSKDTHLVKQSFSKDDRAKMTEDELKKIPILGNLSVPSTQPVKTQLDLAKDTTDYRNDLNMKDDDDLPF